MPVKSALSDPFAYVVAPIVPRRSLRCCVRSSRSDPASACTISAWSSAGIVTFLKEGEAPGQTCDRLSAMNLNGQTRTFGGLYDIFQLKEPGVLRGRRSACSHDRKIMIWKTQALCATVRPK